MQVTEIVVTAGRTFNHPYESYSNLRPQVVLKASLAEDENFAEAVKKLQAEAESLVEDHKNHLLRSLEQLERLRVNTSEAASLGRQIEKAQQWLDELRAAHPDLDLPRHAGESG